MFRFPQRDEADSPWPIFERVLRFPELAELASILEQDCAMAFVFRAGEFKLRGQAVLGTACLPRVQGALAPLFDQLLEDVLGYPPDFLITLGADWWAEASPQEREILVFHEALHCGQAKDQYGTLRFDRMTGRPVLSMVPHDLEEFNAVVARYGAWKGDVEAFLAAAGSYVPPPGPSATAQPDDDVF